MEKASMEPSLLSAVFSRTPKWMAQRLFNVEDAIYHNYVHMQCLDQCQI